MEKEQFTAIISGDGVSFYIVENGVEEHLLTYPVIWIDGLRFVSTAAIRFVNGMVSDGWEFLPIDDERAEGGD